MSSFWNAQLAANAPLDPLSGVYVADLQRQLGQWVPWINTTSYSTPVYTVPANQPAVRVTLDYSGAPDLQQAWQSVPIPPNATAAAGTDQHMVVWQPSTDTMWEFWHAVKQADGWHARWGGRMLNVSSNPGYYTNPSNWGATATSLPLLGGLIRIDELRAGRIDHALALAIPESRAAWFSWPAQRTDGTISSTSAIPQGARLRLDPNLNLDTLPMSRLVRIMAKAAQQYGIVIRDRAGSISFFAEDPTPTGSDPYRSAGGFFEGRYPDYLLAQFPWSRLQVLQTSLRQ